MLQIFVYFNSTFYWGHFEAPCARTVDTHVNKTVLAPQIARVQLGETETLKHKIAVLCDAYPGQKHVQGHFENTAWRAPWISLGVRGLTQYCLQLLPAEI